MTHLITYCNNYAPKNMFGQSQTDQTNICKLLNADKYFFKSHVFVHREIELGILMSKLSVYIFTSTSLFTNSSKIYLQFDIKY